MRHRAFTVVEAIVVVAILAIAALLLFPIFAGSRPYPSDRKGSCTSNLKQIALGFAQYTQDYDEKYPPVANARAGYWAGSLQPYVKSWWIFQCPTESSGVVPKTTDYFYNSRLSSLEVGEIAALPQTILSGDGKGDQLPLYHLSQLPPTWLHDAQSPATRHLGGAYYAFADGHVKWLKPRDITLDKPSAGKPTFLIGRNKP